MAIQTATEQPPARKPRPPRAPRDLQTRREIADAFHVHMQTVTKWERSGLPIAERGGKGRPSRYSLADVREWLEGKRANPQRNGADLAVERARKERAQAILAEQMYQARSRELLPAAEVERAWAAEVAAVRAAILATYTTAADRIHRTAILEGVAGVERDLRELATTLLRELASPERDLPAA
jgi:phage terminase Nu1 subunit (DNA packaging protein)